MEEYGPFAFFERVIEAGKPLERVHRAHVLLVQLGEDEYYQLVHIMVPEIPPDERLRSAVGRQTKAQVSLKERFFAL
jgi:hypothetical protein